MPLFDKLSVSTYVNPHVFWLIKCNTEDSNDIQTNLNKLLQESDSEKYSNHVFEEGELIAAQLKNQLHRAVLQSSEYRADGYLCWLIDYGTLVETDTIYKLPLHLRKIPPLAFQACLNNVVYVQEQLTYDEQGQAKKGKEASLSPHPKIRQLSINLLSKCKSVQFQMEEKFDGIYFGDILYRDDENNLKSFKEHLIDSGFLVKNESMFQSIKTSISDYSQRNLSLIYDISKRTKILLNVRAEIESTCKKISYKYLDEFGDVDDMDENQLTSLQSVCSSSSMSDSDQALSSAQETIQTKTGEKNFKDIENEGTMSKPRKIWDMRMKILNDSLSSDDSFANKKQNAITDPMSSALLKETSQDSDFDNGQNYLGTVNSETKSIFADGFPFVTKNKSKRANKKQPVFLPAGGENTQLKNKKKYRNNSDSVDSVDSVDNINTTKEDTISSKQTATEDTETDSNECKSNNSNDLGSRSSISDNTNRMIIKPKCNCLQCTLWTNETEPLDKCAYSKSKKLIEEFPKNALFKPENENESNQVNIVSLDYDNMTKVQKQSKQKLLVHSECLPKPVKLISQVNFNTAVHKSLLKNDYKEAKRIQIYSWPALLRNQHTFLIHGPKTGKTMAYLPVICTFLLEKIERYSSTKTGGPVAVILCSNSKKCEDVLLLTQMLFEKNRSVSLITSPINYGNVHRVDLLITTPPVIMELLRNRVINFKRLCHFILEDTDQMVYKFPNMLNKLLYLIENMLANRIESKLVQLIVCGEHWNMWTEAVLKKLDKVPIVCIGNYLEAALYGKMQFSMKFVNSACKEQELKNLLKDTYNIRKSMIACKNAEIEEVRLILTLKGINATVISEDLSIEDILYHEKAWANTKGGEFTVLVSTDFLINTVLTVTSASVLIHYSLPSTWTKFVKRFSCLLESLDSPIRTTKEINICHSVVLCDENCEDQMHKFFNYINTTDLKNKLPEKLIQFSEGLNQLEEEKKVDCKIGLCQNLKLFGKCSEIYCKQRHLLDKNLDILDFLPENGKIKFKFLDIHNVTSFTIKPIHYIDNEKQTHAFSNLIDITQEVTDTLRISRRRTTNPMLGHYYVYFIEAEDIYYRCQIIAVGHHQIKICLIDRGEITFTTKPKLYILPKEFNIKHYPPAGIEIYLANYIPAYQDETFSYDAFSKLKYKLEENDYKNKIFVGDIQLKLGCTLWLQNIYEEIVLSDATVQGLQLSGEIACLKLAEYSAKQLDGLYQLCREVDIPIPKVEVVEVKCTKQAKVENQWAFLDVDKLNEVIFCAAISCDEIYFRLYKYNDLLYMLQKDIQESIRKPNYPKLKNIKPGLICLAKDSEDLEYCRVIVAKIQDDHALCFFVDFGDESVIPSNELLSITDKLILQLPFQSIKCKLDGLRPVLSEWHADIVTILYDYSMEPQTDIFRSLYVKVVSKEKSSVLHKTRYSVLLKDGFGKKNVLINQLVIDCGLALPSSEEIEDFDLPPIKYETDENDVDEYETYDNRDGFVDSNFGEMDFFVEDAAKFVKEYIVSYKNESKKKIETYSKETTEKKEEKVLPQLMPAAHVSDYLTPEVYWYQTETTVRISIRLIDSGYKVSLTKGRFLNFSCSKNVYKLKLMLYEKIESMQHSSVGLDIRIILTKLKSIEWPRLIVPKNKPRNIHFDALMVNDKEEHKKILELPKELDEEVSDDENLDAKKDDVMYFVFSDLDSDLDDEVPYDSD